MPGCTRFRCRTGHGPGSLPEWPGGRSGFRGSGLRRWIPGSAGRRHRSVPEPGRCDRCGHGSETGNRCHRRHRELVEVYLRIMALGNAAVHQDIYAAAAVFRLNLDQVAGAGDGPMWVIFIPQSLNIFLPVIGDQCEYRRLSAC
jgi:hypothetical protein